ncbi:hypothetical protein TYRP_020558 [Tyrophagus putrescentiae]|nr:hypothetical protein TYRP_020558 [Tyrophagus putrescentiae]
MSSAYNAFVAHLLFGELLEAHSYIRIKLLRQVAHVKTSQLSPPDYSALAHPRTMQFGTLNANDLEHISVQVCKQEEDLMTGTKNNRVAQLNLFIISKKKTKK